MPLHADLYYLDQPAPVSLQHGEFMLSGRLQSGGGILARAGVGLFDRLTLGLSYGVDSVFGASRPRPTPVEAIGLQARLLGLKEGTYVPAAMVGFESQGFDGYDTDSSRFVTLQPGVFLVLAKTFWTTRTEVSIGANYKPQPSPSGFDGHIVVCELYPADWGFIAEYDLALDENHLAGGLLNFGVVRTVAGTVQLKLALRDILGQHHDNALNRVFEISLVEHF